ncbi:MAG TPA: YheC/YheD family protein [Clostridiaceae bacterium]|nr:YheC/YheD family protein [Clostridiaceae bacterium]
MWAKIEVVPSEYEIIYLPSQLKKSGYIQDNVVFGDMSVRSSVEYSKDLTMGDGSFEKPGRIRISDKLMKKLMIPESLVYRVKVTDSSVAIGPVIGFLLGIHTHRYTPRHMEKYSDRFGIYNKVGGLIYAFSPKSVDWKKRIAYGLYYNIAASSWEYGCFPLPEVIYRRDFHSNPSYIKMLMEITGGRLFNSYRFSKYELFEYLRTDSELCKHIPPTELSLNFDQVREFIDRHSKVIFKPVDLSRGRGICVIEKNDTIYKITDYRYRNPIVTVLYDKESFEKFFAINQNLFNKYIIQKYLPLARIGNSLFDIRVVMQKGKDKTWGCTGIECRISSNRSHLTNISRGGYALSLNEALHRAFSGDFNTISKQINDLCLKFCLFMDDSGEHFAEFGIDIAIDTDNNLWLIEANVFPSFKGFKKMDRDTYLSIRYTPLLYALSLTRFGE